MKVKHLLKLLSHMTENVWLQARKWFVFKSSPDLLAYERHCNCGCV